MDKYVVGFLFSPDLRFVVLIRKNRPEWQNGLLNGVGGHWETGESGPQAMAREFLEETGVDIPVGAWKFFHKMDHPNSHLRFYVSTSAQYLMCHTTTDEPIALYDSLFLTLEVIPNLHWLIPLAKYCWLGEQHGQVIMSTSQHWNLHEGEAPDQGS